LYKLQGYIYRADQFIFTESVWSLDEKKMAPNGKTRKGYLFASD